MQSENNMICERIRIVIANLKQELQVLYGTTDFYTKNILVRQVATKVDELAFLNQLLCATDQRQEEMGLLKEESIQKVFTLEELARYNGKDGNHAYIAVGKNVYDVTNNAAWAAGTHFGSQAGQDVSAAYVACHKGEDVLSQLPVVGIMA